MGKEIELDGTQYIHLEDRSCYNNNYYQHKENGEIILEICDEFYGEYEFYRVSSNSEFLLGRSDQDITKGVITIHTDWL